CEDGQVRLWDSNTHEQVAQPLSRNLKLVFDVSFSPDDRLVAAAYCAERIDFNCTRIEVRLWDAATRRQVTAPIRTPFNSQAMLGFTPDGLLALAGCRVSRPYSFCEKSELQFWRPSTGKAIGP